MPGPYHLNRRPANPGFKNAYLPATAQLTSESGDSLEINVNLEVGSATESIKVTAEAAQLQTETSSSGAVLEGNYLQQLPLYQRYVESTFLPGSQHRWGRNSALAVRANLQGWHIDGLSDVKIGFFQDGTYAVANNNGTVYTAQTIQTTVEEVKVIGTVLPAEYGHSGGGALMALSSGPDTNALHGEISRIWPRQRVCSSGSYFDLILRLRATAGRATVAVASELFMQPNATLSGPVYIPKLYNGKNKTFFFFAVERVIRKTGQSRIEPITVPDASRCLQATSAFAGQGVTANPLYYPNQHDAREWAIHKNPHSRQHYPPVADRSGSGQVHRSSTPYALPNAPEHLQQHRPVQQLPGHLSEEVLFGELHGPRRRQQITPNLKIFGNWLYKTIYQRSPNPQISNRIFDSSLVLEHDRNNTATLGATKVFGPTLINDFRLGYNRFVALITGPDANANTGAAAWHTECEREPTCLPGGLPLTGTLTAPSINTLESTSR